MREFSFNRRIDTVRYLLLLVGGLVLLGGTSKAGAGEFITPGAAETGRVADWVLIYAGGAHRPDWTPTQFEPYVVYADPDSGQEQWLFDGFLFIEFKDARGQEYAKGYGHEPARKEHWVWLLDRLFEEGKALHALDEVVGRTAAKIGAPTRARRVTITLPEPIVTLADWGELNGKALDFSNADDRIAAVGWYLTELQRRWQEAGFQNLKLEGIYWVAETTANKGEQVLPRVSELVHSHGWKFLWIPYWRAAGAGDWKALGFDAAYQQPNHFFHPDKVNDDRLPEAVAFAKAHDMGMEMEWDSRAMSQQELFLPRMHAYLDAFEKTGAMQHAAMAHYEGGGAMIKLSQHKAPPLQEAYRRYCQAIVKRQKALDRKADSIPKRNTGGR
jgi:Domain of unknown function (DUF4855)